MRLIAAVLFVLSLSTAASAQTIADTINLYDLGLGDIDTPRAVDTDGDPVTQEWLIYNLTTRRYLVLAQRAEGTCAGRWFYPGPRTFERIRAEVQRIGAVDVLVANHGGISVHLVRLDTPVCLDRPHQ